jgi:hypothetical protein
VDVRQGQLAGADAKLGTFQGIPSVVIARRLLRRAQRRDQDILRRSSGARSGARPLPGLRAHRVVRRCEGAPIGAIRQVAIGSPGTLGTLGTSARRLRPPPTCSLTPRQLRVRQINTWLISDGLRSGYGDCA